MLLKIFSHRQPLRKGQMYFLISSKSYEFSEHYLRCKGWITEVTLILGVGVELGFFVNFSQTFLASAVIETITFSVL